MKFTPSWSHDTDEKMLHIRPSTNKAQRCKHGRADFYLYPRLGAASTVWPAPAPPARPARCAPAPARPLRALLAPAPRCRRGGAVRRALCAALCAAAAAAAAPRCREPLPLLRSALLRSAPLIRSRVVKKVLFLVFVHWVRVGCFFSVAAGFPVYSIQGEYVTYTTLRAYTAKRAFCATSARVTKIQALLARRRGPPAGAGAEALLATQQQQRTPAGQKRRVSSLAMDALTRGPFSTSTAAPAPIFGSVECRARDTSCRSKRFLTKVGRPRPAEAGLCIVAPAAQ